MSFFQFASRKYIYITELEKCLRVLHSFWQEECENVIIKLSLKNRVIYYKEWANMSCLRRKLLMTCSPLFSQPKDDTFVLEVRVGPCTF